MAGLFGTTGLTSGVGNAVFNQNDSVASFVVDNSYTAATGGQGHSLFAGP